MNHWGGNCKQYHLAADNCDGWSKSFASANSKVEAHTTHDLEGASNNTEFEVVPIKWAFIIWPINKTNNLVYGWHQKVVEKGKVTDVDFSWDLFDYNTVDSLGDWDSKRKKDWDDCWNLLVLDCNVFVLIVIFKSRQTDEDDTDKYG